METFNRNVLLSITVITLMSRFFDSAARPTVSNIPVCSFRSEVLAVRSSFGYAQEE